jgi:hypothetical protein
MILRWFALLASVMDTSMPSTTAWVYGRRFKLKAKFDCGVWLYQNLASSADIKRCQTWDQPTTPWNMHSNRDRSMIHPQGTCSFREMLIQACRADSVRQLNSGL